MNVYTNWTQTAIERLPGGSMTIRQAAKIVHTGGGFVSPALLDEAREVVRLAVRSGFVFRNDGTWTWPPYKHDPDADRDESRYAAW